MVEVKNGKRHILFMHSGGKDGLRTIDCGGFRFVLTMPIRIEEGISYLFRSRLLNGLQKTNRK